MLVTAPNVIIRNSKISCTGNYVIDVTSNSSTASATITSVTIDCSTNWGGTAIGEHNLIVSKVNISHCVNGFDIDANANIADSWCHDLTDEVQFPTAHTDCVQGIMTNHVTINHNTFFPGEFATSAIGGGVAGANWVVVNNLLDGGAYPVYCHDGGAGINSSVSDNRFGQDGWNAVMHNAPLTTGCDQPNIAWSGNVFDRTGLTMNPA